MSSGVAVNSECIEKYQSLKLGKKAKYIIFQLSPDNKEIVVAKTGTDPSYDDFLAQLPADSCRYAVYDFEYKQSDSEGVRNKLCFYAWSPDTAKIKSKMIYASSKDALRKTLVGIAVEIQGTDESEVAYDAVLDKCTRR